MRETPPPPPAGPEVRKVRYDAGFSGWLLVAVFVGMPMAIGLIIGLML